MLSCDLFVYTHECVDDYRVMHRSTSVEQDRESIAVRHLRAIGAIGREGIKTVHHSEDSGTNRYIGSFQSRRVSSAIPALVMMSDNWHDWVWKLNRGQNVGANA